MRRARLRDLGGAMELVQMTPDEFSEYGRVIGENLKLRDALRNANRSLYSVIGKMTPKDDRLLCNHIRHVHAELCRVIGELK